MPDMHHLVEIDGTDADAAYAALTTENGITGWWTSRAAVAPDRLSMNFPDAPVSWDMTVTTAEPAARVEWDCTGGPPGWPGTHLVWALQPTPNGVVVRFDHTGFADVDDMFRIVTVGWAQMLLSLKDYLATGIRKPFFSF